MYISLHNRSAYSFGSALTMPAELAAFAADQHMPAIALTDLNGLYAAIAFQQACRQVNVKPIFGAELVLADGTGITLLARSLTGYGNLCRLVSRQHLGDRPIDWANLCEHAEDLICLLWRLPVEKPPSYAPPSHATGLNGLEPSDSAKLFRPPLARGDHRGEVLLDAFAGRFYVELCLHAPEDVPGARRRARWADDMSIPVVAGCRSRCLRPDQLPVLRALSSIGTLTLLDRPHPDKPFGHWHLRTPAEMQRLFRRRPDALANTLSIAEQCNVTLDLTRDRFPKFVSPDGRSAIEHLRELCVAGCRRRYVEQPQQRGIGGKRPTLAEALTRLDRELAVIEQVHYAEYFLVFHEIVQYCRSQGIATLARGSAADSLICYALGVSHACPFRFDLPFDRFVNPERAKFSKMADIDLDLPWDQRDEVIRWIYDRWGHDHVAMIGSPNTFQARAAVAELAKVFGLPPQEVHQFTKHMHQERTRNLAASVAAAPEMRESITDEEPYRTILRMAGALEGLPRHWAMHPCGLVVSPEPMTELVPVQRSPKGPLIAQYDMDAIEALGFIKIDLLGQAGLSVLRATVLEVARTEHLRIDLETDVDYAEAETWEMIATSGARGVHHIESPAMTNLLAQCDCRDIDCLTTIVALIRPGAANEGKKEAFARRHQGFEEPSCVHPSIEPVLKDTYGLMVFEEHILQIAVEFAGLNLGRADTLRRALNKNNRVLIAELKAEFFAAARAAGRCQWEIDAVWPLLEQFGGFMFNKAHSAEYAVEAFQGAWLKRRWPAHYLAAILSNYRGFYANSPTLPQIVYVLEALRLGIGFLPPCVNRSREHFAVEKDERMDLFIRVPVTHVKGLSTRFLERYLSERAKDLFTSLADFVNRCRSEPVDAQLLLDSGALDGLCASRPAAFWQLHQLLHRTALGQATLWDTDRMGTCAEPPIELTHPDKRRIAQREMELLGFPITIDPLTLLSCDEKEGWIDWSQYVPVDQLDRYPDRRVRVCGLMVADRINATQTGELMKFVTLADRTGFVETILFPQVYQRFGHLTAAYPILAATGVVEPFQNRKGFALRVQNIFPPISSGLAPASLLAPDRICRENTTHSQSASNIVE